MPDTASRAGFAAGGEDKPHTAAGMEPEDHAPLTGGTSQGEPPIDLAPVVGGLQDEIASLNERLLRAHAEMDNMRKRAEREKADTAKYAITKFATDIVTVGDNLGRALAAVSPEVAEASPALKALVEGVTMTDRVLVSTLERHGVKRIDPAGEIFNPHLHQAIAQVTDPSVSAGTIVQVHQSGYIIEERVLRPAMVVVAEGGAKPSKAQAGSQGTPQSQAGEPGHHGTNEGADGADPTSPQPGSQG